MTYIYTKIYKYINTFEIWKFSSVDYIMQINHELIVIKYFACGIKDEF